MGHRGDYLVVQLRPLGVHQQDTFVTRQNARSVVLISEEDYQELMETVHLLKSPANAMRLLRSIKEAEEGKLTKREPVEPTRSKTAIT